MYPQLMICHLGVIVSDLVVILTKRINYLPGVQNQNGKEVSLQKKRLSVKLTQKTLVKRGKWIGLFRRGGCSFSQKIRLATRLGAAGAIIIDNQDTDEPIAMNTLGKKKRIYYSILIRNLGTSIPSTIITKADGEELVRLMRQSSSPLIIHKQVGRVKLAPSPAEENSPNTSIRIIASFNPLIEKQAIRANVYNDFLLASMNSFLLLTIFLL